MQTIIEHRILFLIEFRHWFYNSIILPDRITPNDLLDNKAVSNPNHNIYQQNEYFDKCYDLLKNKYIDLRLAFYNSQEYHTKYSLIENIQRSEFEALRMMNSF